MSQRTLQLWGLKAEAKSGAKETLGKDRIAMLEVVTRDTSEDQDADESVEVESVGKME